MKSTYLIVLIMLVFSVSSFGAVTCDSDAVTVKRDNQSLRVQFGVLSDTKLENVEVSLLNPKTGNYHKIIRRTETTADKKKNTDNLNHFDVSSDATDKYELRLPKTFSSESSFKGYLFIAFEHGKPLVTILDCK